MNPTRSLLLALVVSGPLLAGCGSSSSDSPAAAASTSATAASAASSASSVSSAPSAEAADAADRIPEATWTRDATTADAEALGLDPADLGPLPIHVSLKLAGDRWTFFYATGDNAPTSGDTGTSTYQPGGRWETDNGQNAYTYAWSVDGDRLTLSVVAQDPENTDTPADSQIVRLISEGTYTRS